MARLSVSEGMRERAQTFRITIFMKQTELVRRISLGGNGVDVEQPCVLKVRLVSPRTYRRVVMLALGSELEPARLTAKLAGGLAMRLQLAHEERRRSSGRARPDPHGKMSMLVYILGPTLPGTCFRRIFTGDDNSDGVE